MRHSTTRVLALAAWLTAAWSRLRDEDIALLTAVGATPWREGFAQRQI
jgi:hypothetical protein